MENFLEGYSWVEVTGFFVLVVICLMVDLYAHKKDEAISVKNAAIWTVFWIVLAVAFSGYICLKHGTEDMYLYLTGYVLEKSLSVDNLFVMMAIFANFAVKDKFQHRVLYFGIIGAIFFRLIFILAGTTFVHLLGWIAMLVFAAFILWSAWKMWESMRSGNEDIEDYSNHWAIKFTKRFVPVHHKLEGHNFFTKVDGRLFATPLLMCLIVIEIADVMFAFDSVPAILGVTSKLFLVYTSNIFAILGLRSMYFMLAAAKNMLCHLEKAVIAILIFIGYKMLIAGLCDMPYFKADLTMFKPSSELSLWIVLGLLVAGIAASLMWPEKKDGEDGAPDGEAKDGKDGEDGDPDGEAKDEKDGEDSADRDGGEDGAPSPEKGDEPGDDGKNS